MLVRFTHKWARGACMRAAWPRCCAHEFGPTLRDQAHLARGAHAVHDHLAALGAAPHALGRGLWQWGPVPLPGKAPPAHHSILFPTSGRGANAMSWLGCGSRLTSLLVLMELAVLGAQVNAAPAEPATRSVDPRASPVQDDSSGAAHRCVYDPRLAGLTADDVEQRPNPEPVVPVRL
jgi:hypothetical protein